MPIYHFVSGLPRSGSTLLCNILGQNPDFHVTSTSGILDVIFGVRNNWDNLIEFKASPNPEGKNRVLKGILDSYYADVNKPFIFDKSRGWLAYIELIEDILGYKVKILVPVRDIRDVLASFEKLWRKNPTNQFAQESDNYFNFQTVEGRCKVWLESNSPVGLAHNRIRDALSRGLRNRLHFVPFSALTTTPKQTMEGIYKFLEKTPYEHDFECVPQLTHEDDFVHGITGLHDIRSKVEPMPPQWPTILGKWAESYSRFNFWDDYPNQTKP